MIFHWFIGFCYYNTELFLVAVFGGLRKENSDEIISKAQRLSKIMKKLSDSTHKSGDTVYALRERLDRSLKETEDVRQRLKQTSGECS